MDKKSGENSEPPEAAPGAEAPATAAGLASAMEALRAELGSPPDAPRARQLPLIPTRGAGEDDPGLAAVANEGGKRGPGRPPGATNEATREWRDWILSRYPSPLIFLAEVCSRPASALAQELRCPPLDAIKVQLRAAETLAGYMHSKMPVAVEIEARGQVPIVFNISPQLGDLIEAAGGAMGNRGPFKVIDAVQGKSTTYEPAAGGDGQSDDGQDG